MMTLRGFLQKICMLAFVCLTLVSLAVAVEAQQRILWQGGVNREQINVYANPSTSERVTTTLKKDDVVNVILEISVMGDAWCRVASPGQPEPFGYVLCFNLEKGHFPAPQQAAAPQSTAKPEPPGNSYTPENAIDPEKSQIESWAEQGVSILRDNMKDPTAFTVLQVIARTHPLSTLKGKLIDQWGCVHYFGTNSYGGRGQHWGGYQLKSGKGGKKDSFYIWGDFDPDTGQCPVLRKNETEIDVTEAVKKFLSEHPYL